MDKKNVYDAEIGPLVHKIKNICIQHGIPFFFAAAVADNGEITKYEADIISPAVLEVRLSNDKITKMLNVMNGFDVVPPSRMEIIDF